MSGKTYLLIVWLSLLAVAMGLYATGPDYVNGVRCTSGFSTTPMHCGHRAAAWGSASGTPSSGSRREGGVLPLGADYSAGAARSEGAVVNEGAVLQT
jgi:hypothetical protein